MSTTDEPETPHPLLYTVTEAARLLKVSRTTAYQMVRDYFESGGRNGVPAIRVRRLVRLPHWSLMVFIDTGEVVNLLELAADNATALPGGRVPRSSGRRRAGAVEQLRLLPGEPSR
jgi:excisionase family DNA binding protein